LSLFVKSASIKKTNYLQYFYYIEVEIIKNIIALVISILVMNSIKIASVLDN